MNFAQLFAGFGGQVAQSMSNPGTDANGYLNAIGKLFEHAGRWSAVSAAGIRCHTRVRSANGPQICGGAAIGACEVCKQPVCFGHSFICPTDGAIVCAGCVARSVRERSEQRPEQKFESSNQKRKKSGLSDEEKTRRAHLRVMGLKPTDEWAKIQETYKKLVFRYHPDRPGNTKRDAQKMTKINEAYRWLQSWKEKAA